jgi:succinate dehydrogenase / fumarate reductase, cytochrome b subunit
MSKKQPINLDLRTLHFPLPAIASILHRISGVVIFLLMPFMLYVSYLALDSVASFENLKENLALPHMQLLLLAFLAALSYHLLAGIRHLIMDLGYFETPKSARITTLILFLIFAIFIIFLGSLIWQ